MKYTIVWFLINIIGNNLCTTHFTTEISLFLYWIIFPFRWLIDILIVFDCKHFWRESNWFVTTLQRIQFSHSFLRLLLHLNIFLAQKNREKGRSQPMYLKTALCTYNQLWIKLGEIEAKNSIGNLKAHLKITLIQKTSNYFRR